MADRMRTRGTGRQRRSTVTSLITHSDPIALIGIVLALALSIALDVTGAANGVQSLLAGLMVTTISLVLDASARAERRFQLRRMVESTDWLAGAVTSTVVATKQIVDRYPGSEIEAEARQRLQRLSEELDDLGRGRIERSGGDFEYLMAATRACTDRIEAVTNVVGEPTWWLGGIGPAYWQANLDAIARGVRVTRVFICDQPTDELNALVERQRQAGVTVTVVERQTLDPELHVNFVVWDGRRAWEARMNAHGTIVANLFLINEHDVARLRGLFRRLMPARTTAS